jgi:hypothetical protein
MNVFWIAFFVAILSVVYAVVRRNAGVAVLGVFVAGVLTFFGASYHAVADILKQPAWVNILTAAAVTVVFAGLHLRHTQNSERPLGYAYLIAIALGLPVQIWQMHLHGAFINTLNELGTLLFAFWAINKLIHPEIKEPSKGQTPDDTATGGSTGRRIGSGGRRIVGPSDETNPPTDGK